MSRYFIWRIENAYKSHVGGTTRSGYFTVEHTVYMVVHRNNVTVPYEPANERRLFESIKGDVKLTTDTYQRETRLCVRNWLL